MLLKTFITVYKRLMMLTEAQPKHYTVTFNSIRKILPDHSILNACRQEKYDYRCRLMTPIVIVLHMITAAIWPEDSFNAAWQLA